MGKMLDIAKVRQSNMKSDYCTKYMQCPWQIKGLPPPPAVSPVHESPCLVFPLYCHNINVLTGTFWRLCTSTKKFHCFCLSLKIVVLLVQRAEGERKLEADKRFLKRTDHCKTWSDVFEDFKSFWLKWTKEQNSGLTILSWQCTFNY